MADETTNQQPTPEGGAQTGETLAADAKPVTFEDWYETLEPERQEVLDAHIDGLKSALKSERDERKAVERQLRDLAKQADEGSELRAQLDRMATEAQTATAKAEFFQAGHAANVKNLRLAWLAATDAGLVDAKTGECDFGKLKQVAPELFAQKPTTSNNAGNGAGQTGAAQPSMNDWLRQAAGRTR